MAYIYFQKYGILKSAQTKWNEMKDGSKTWLGFKDHFQAEHKAIKWSCALTIQDTFNRDTVVNMVCDELNQVLLANQDQLEITDISEVEGRPTTSTSTPRMVTT